MERKNKEVRKEEIKSIIGKVLQTNK